jgi:hypothetical protein
VNVDKFYEELSAKYPKSDAAQRYPLNFLTGIKVCDYPNFARGQIQGAFGQIP